jgi:hypothetical protein
MSWRSKRCVTMPTWFAVAPDRVHTPDARAFAAHGPVFRTTGREVATGSRAVARTEGQANLTHAEFEVA